MEIQSADWQNREVPPLNCLGNDVKLILTKPIWLAGLFPVDYLSLKSFFTYGDFG
jgi:hypothetical protein